MFKIRRGHYKLTNDNVILFWCFFLVFLKFSLSNHYFRVIFCCYNSQLFSPNYLLIFRSHFLQLYEHECVQCYEDNEWSHSIENEVEPDAVDGVVVVVHPHQGGYNAVLVDKSCFFLIWDWNIKIRITWKILIFITNQPSRGIFYVDAERTQF